MKWSWIIFSYLSLVAFGLLDNIRGPIYPEILKWFSIGTTQGSLIFSISSFCGLLTCFANHFWLKRFGALKSLKFFIFLMALSILGMGWSGYFSQGFFLLVFFSGLFGVSTGGSGICMNILVAQGSSGKWRRRALSGLHSMYGLASLFAPLFAAFWFKFGFKWSHALMLLSLFPSLIFLGSFLFLKDKNETRYSQAPALSLPFSYYIIFGLLFAFCVSAELSLSTQIPLYCETILHWDTTKADFYLVLFFLFLFLGRFIFSLVHFPGRSYYWLLLSTGGSMICYYLGLRFHPFFLPLAGFFISIFFPCAVDWMSELFHNRIDKLMANVMTVVGIFVVGMHAMIGRAADLWGLGQALMIGPVSLLLGMLLLLYINKKSFK